MDIALSTNIMVIVKYLQSLHRINSLQEYKYIMINRWKTYTCISFYTFSFIKRTSNIQNWKTMNINVGFLDTLQKSSSSGMSESVWFVPHMPHS